MPRNPEVDRYLSRTPEHARPLLARLRVLIHEAVPAVTEEIKWGAPTFMKSGMICSFHAFKTHVGLWFHKGALLKDPKRLLQPGSTARTMKVLKLGFEDRIDTAGIADLVKQAAEINDKGVKVERAPIRVVVPPALKKALAASPKARALFDSLAPSHRREYSNHVAEAKKPETVQRRVAKTISELEKGRRPNEKYR